MIGYLSLPCILRRPLTSTNSPGVVEYKNFSNSEFAKLYLIKDSLVVPTTGELPQILAPSGLSSDYQWYLYDKIRAFCSKNTQHAHFHLFQGVYEQTHQLKHPPMRPTMTDTSPPTKRSRICGKCDLSSGHNRRSCK